ncbi:MAG: prepilin-type N-terminal cleavage/methylation domain-containing protein [Rhodocyclaceae bacterium]
MPTSVPGNSDRVAVATLPPAALPTPAPRRARGFTLIEVLVVLTILGLAISGVSLSLEALRGRDTDLALERLRWVLEASAERARIRGQAIAFDPLPDGYRFSILDTDGRWIAFEEGPIFVEKVLPDGLAWSDLRVEGQRASRIVFASRAPRFELQVRTRDGVARLAGRTTGVVDLRRPGAT